MKPPQTTKAEVKQSADSLENDIALFRKWLTSLKETITEMSAHIVRRLEQNPGLFQLWMQKMPAELDADFLRGLERVGRKQLHAGIFLNLNGRNPGLERLACCPFPVQERYVKDAVPIVVRAGKSFRTEFKPVSKLTQKEAGQVFSGEMIREPEEQKALLERAIVPLRTTRQEFEVLPDGTLIAHGFIVPKPCVLESARRYMEEDKKQLEGSIKRNQLRVS